jgi:hypothetical protein
MPNADAQPEKAMVLGMPEYVPQTIVATVSATQLQAGYARRQVQLIVGHQQGRSIRAVVVHNGPHGLPAVIHEGRWLDEQAVLTV